MTAEELDESFARARRNLSRMLPKCLLPSYMPRDNPHVRLFQVEHTYIAQLCLRDYAEIKSVNVISLCLSRVHNNLARTLNIMRDDLLFVLASEIVMLAGHARYRRYMEKTARIIVQTLGLHDAITICTSADIMFLM